MDKNKFLAGFAVFMVICAIIAGIYLLFGGQKAPAKRLPAQQAQPRTLPRAVRKTPAQNRIQAQPRTSLPAQTPDVQGAQQAAGQTGVPQAPAGY